jgi:hypothetical protein
MVLSNTHFANSFFFEKVDSLYFDHHLTTTVQFPFKTPKKPVVTTNNRLFLVLGTVGQT